MQLPILTINTGSSSLKLGLYRDSGAGETLLVEGLADGIGQEQGTLTLRDGTGKMLHSATLTRPTQKSALREAMACIREKTDAAPGAVGHRIVHGGPYLTQHQRITVEVLQQLRQCVHFAPLHIPMALELIEEAGRAYPGTPQFACFDTAFHRTLPESAAMFPLPRALFDEGIRRYGFHGLSYESIVQHFGARLPARVVMAHLGSGASLAAVKNGESVDTTMGLTPTGGIPMATRSGDLDPGVLLYLLRSRGASADSLEPLLNHEAGLKAISGGTPDMRRLQAMAEKGNAPARLAVDIFCTAVSKTVGAYAAVLNGLDLLVFAGGIGEHSAAVRAQICERLGFLGIQLDASGNEAAAPTISSAASPVRVCVVGSQEDLQIARHCSRLMTGESPQAA